VGGVSLRSTHRQLLTPSPYYYRS